MQVISLRPGDSAWAVSERYTIRYVGKESDAFKLELTIEGRGSFTVASGKSVFATTVIPYQPVEFSMQAGSWLHVMGAKLSIRELPSGKLAVNYFGNGQFAVAPCLV